MKFIFFVIFIVLSTSLTVAKAGVELRCAHIFYRQTLRVLKANPSYSTGPRHFSVRDLNDPEIRWAGHLDSGNVLSLFFALKFPEKGYRSSLQGHQLFRETLEYFGAKNIKKISDNWVDGTSYEQFFNNRKRGLSETESALLTWEGKQASLYGFSRVEAVEIYENPLTLKKIIMVTFTRP